MEQTKHNPYFKLVSKYITGYDLFKYGYTGRATKVQFVYSISNKGEHEGLELYFYGKSSMSGHYMSKRYLTDKLPKRYDLIFNELKTLLPEVKEGHKLEVN